MISFSLNFFFGSMSFAMISYAIMRMKRNKLDEKAKNKLVAIFLVIIGFIIFIYFFENKDFIFRCNYSTQSCEYYKSTLHNPRIRLVDKYSLNGINYIDVVKHKRHTKHGTRTHYTVDFFKDLNKEFYIHHNFYTETEARREVNLIIKQVFADKGIYEYARYDEDGETGKVFILFLTCLYFIISGFVCLFNLKNEDKIKKIDRYKREQFFKKNKGYSSIKKR
ncbi:MAG: hypothetical protein MJ247_02905 [Alphaproteobacteria bacterium]|nr:hypothetical protein [Alphaproteobacteria bacterium]